MYHHHITYIQVFAIVWGESSTRTLFFFFFSVFKHYKATAINSHRYKYHSLPLLDDLRFVFFFISAAFSNTILCETKIYKNDKEKFC